MPRDSNGHVTPGHIAPARGVPAGIPRPEYVGRPGPREYTGTNVYDAAHLALIRESGMIAARAVDAVGDAIRPGITTNALDVIAHDSIVGQGAYPSTVGYRGFQKSVCTSINEVICHGIPDDTVLEDGDIINIDITAFKNGVHGDLSKMFMVGKVSQEAADLVERTREAMNRGIRAVAAGREINVIGRAIESYAKRFGYGVVRDFTGHGVGEAFHSGLVIPHYDASPGHSGIMEVGMVFTIEPMLTLGDYHWDMWADGWTVVTRDKSLTAQFEHTIVVTERGADILTLP
jgi:methionyl aminopeptidase